MKNRQKSLIVMIALALMILLACQDHAEELGTDENSSSSNDLATETDEEKENDADLEHVEEPEDMEQEETTDDLDEDVKKEEDASASQGNDAVIPTKTEYLDRLNQMEEADRQIEPESTMPDLEEQEAERYQKWDDELNQIYAILTEQLSPEKMEELRVEQREWVANRDEEALVSSLDYEDDETEALEYVATQATLTRERCYVLVSEYME